MTTPGPAMLGRGVVVRPGADVPSSWDSAERVVVDGTALGDAVAANALVDRLHVAWVRREARVVVWDVADDALAQHEVVAEPAWTLQPGFLFPLERLRFLCFSNNYDMRSGEPKWWWAVKASAVGARPGGTGDVVLADGTEAWIDGGPRQPLTGIELPVIHGESVDAGLTTPVGATADWAPDGLADDQLDAVGHLVGSARIVAPAGSGKTKTLAARLRHLVQDRRVEDRHVMAVAYNARAADELRERVEAGRQTVRTIHSLGWAILNEAHAGLELTDEREVRNTLGALISVPKRANADPMGPYVEALEQVRAGLRDPAAVEGERDDVPGFAEVFEDYRARLYRRRRVDHGEQVYGALEALLGDPALRARWQARCRHMLVDEFQDLTPAYLLLIRLVASPQLQVFGVGDDDQVIYGYAGADPGFLIDYDQYFPGAGHHALQTNYRCPPAVVEGARTLLGYNRRRIDKTITAAKSSELPDALVVRRNPSDELAGAARDLIGEWLDGGVATTDIAVLTRVNSTLIPVKAALQEAGIATNDLLSADSLRRTTLRALFSWLRIASDVSEMPRAEVLEAVRRPGRGLNRIAAKLPLKRLSSVDDLREAGESLDGKQAIRWEDFCHDVERVGSAAIGNDAHRVIRTLLDEIGLSTSARTLDAGRGNASKSSHLDDLVAASRAAALQPDLVSYLDWLAAIVNRPSSADGVTLSSVHRVKGMEWSRVIVFGVDRGAMPHDLADDTEEERRVFHVAVTRAMDQAVILADEARPSRFLAELDGTAPKRPVASPSRAAATPMLLTVAEGDRVTVVGGYKGVVTGWDGGDVIVTLDRGAELTVDRSEIKTVLPSPAKVADESLVEALKAWRLGVAKDRGIPAYVVFHDATLQEIASMKPATERDLLRVSGIGARKLEDYGDDVLAIVADAG